MRRHTRVPVLASLAIAALLAATAAAGAEAPARRVEQSFLPGTAGTVHVDIAIGEIAVKGHDSGERIEVALELYCSGEDVARCTQRAENVRLVAKTDGNRFTIKTKGTSLRRIRGIQARMALEVPAGLALDVNNRVGAVTVGGMRGDVEVDAPAGDVEIGYPQERIALVNLKTAVGKVRLKLRDGSEIKGSGFPRSVRWTSGGSATLNVDVGTGDIIVDLD